jgi:dTDP-4-dehydrorhamnose reductase
MTSVCAIILTFNREELLRSCLAAVRAQSVRCGDIIVVDNASTDGTADLLASPEYSDIEVCRLRDNTGASGGFALGMQLGYATGADVLWVMDDDVIADPDALEKLLNARELLHQRGIRPPFVNSLARSPEGVLTNVPRVAMTLNSLDYPIWPAFLEHGLVAIRRSTFVSILLDRDAIQRHGLPIASMFIWGEDSEFTLRISAEQPGFLCGQSRVQHLRALSGNLDLRKEVDPIRLQWHQFRVRNSIYNRRLHGDRLQLLDHMLRHLVLFFRLIRAGDFRRARLLGAGLASGLTFKPQRAFAEEPIDGDNIIHISPRLAKRAKFSRPPRSGNRTTDGMLKPPAQATAQSRP